MTDALTLEEKVERLLNLLEGRIDVEPAKGPPQSELAIHLEKPLNFMGRDIDTVVLRCPTYEEIKKARAVSRGKADPELEQVEYLVRAVSGLHEDVIKQMPWDKMQDAIEYLEGFFQRGRRT